MSLKSSPLPPPEGKAFYVQDMFGRIARRYDLMNRLMTLGRDQAWRRHTVSQLDLDNRSPGSVLDVATGTGDLALEVLRLHPGALVYGLDFVPQMLVLAQQKAASREQTISGSLEPQTLHLLGGDALRLPFPTGMFDGVVTGFALRNVTDIPATFAEIARVTRPGGRVACLEIAKPSTPFFRHLFSFYFYRLVPLLGGWITGQRSAYTYLPHSLTAFLTPDEIVQVMRRTGWREVRYKRLMLGAVAVHVGVRAGE
ncbi:MAG: ubiquinone/menaquinone biosynthesis methyltransferase [Anaerolineae bacterium]